MASKLGDDISSYTLSRLDAVADRLGALYQLAGDAIWTNPKAKEILDEIVALTDEVERISNRKERSKS